MAKKIINPHSACCSDHREEEHVRSRSQNGKDHARSYNAGPVHGHSEESAHSCPKAGCGCNSHGSENGNKERPARKREAGECRHCSGAGTEEHGHGTAGGIKTWAPVIASFAMLACGLVFEHLLNLSFFSGSARLAWYIAAYLPVGIPVMREAVEAMRERTVFSEFTLMSVATIGAFVIGEYPEAVAVMLFYSVGELFQGMAVDKARGSIKALVEVQAVSAAVMRGGVFMNVRPEDVAVGETIEIKAGEKVPLDSVILAGEGNFNASALTGESRPVKIREGEQVLAGMISLDSALRARVEKLYSDSSLARILDMVQNASSRKAKTELMIRRFARVYTPIVFLLSLMVMFLPALFVDGYVMGEWVYRGLVLLVISCPCALVISIPLGYFGGIGAASRQGILFKGSNYLEQMERINVMVMDKTGTLTHGVFEVRLVMSPIINEYDFVTMAAAVESYSNHPIARAIVDYAGVTPDERARVAEVEEIAGHGLKALYEGREVLAGNARLMRANGIDYNIEVDNIVESVVVIASEGRYLGYIVVSDTHKDDSAGAIAELKSMGIRTVMLSGDKEALVQSAANRLGIDEAYGELLPEDKVAHVERLKKRGNVVGFVGDGINDAPVLALSDVGIAMGGMGSDAAIEVADVVIQSDRPSKLLTAIGISRSTRHIVTQNIVFAIGVKVLVMALGVLGIVSMWAAVFADVGVALLAVLNATRIMIKRF